MNYTLFFLFLAPLVTQAFSPLLVVQPTKRQSTRSSLPTTVFVVPEFSSITVAEESWRQYVSLVVIGGVLIDILLGSPLANLALKPMRGDQEEPKSQDDTKQINRSRERIDSDAVAKAAIERAQNALELRRFLDERKTDWDRMEDMKRKLDADMQLLDEDLRAREESMKRDSK